MGIIMCGTPQCIEDTRRGAFSYEALRSRLEAGRFSRDGMRDISAPVIRLSPLSYEEMLVLVEKLAGIHAELFEYEQTMSREEMIEFIKIEFGRIGADTHITPREVIRDFIELLSIVRHNPNVTVAGLLGSGTFAHASPERHAGAGAEEFEEFEI